MYSTMLLAGLAIIGTTGPKGESSGPPYTEDQLLALLKDKGELTWAEGTYRIKVEKVNDRKLSNVILERSKDGKVEVTIKANLAKIRIGKQEKIMRLFIDEAEITKCGMTAFFRGQEYELPVPLQRKK